jgi:hypothetical protein
MIFQIVHSHTLETCPGKSAEASKMATEWWQAFKQTPGVKVLAGYVSPLDHTFYITVDADDYATLSKAMGMLVAIGTGRVMPVLSLDQTLSVAQAGAFRAQK